jgi:hypothetical protein
MAGYKRPGDANNGCHIRDLWTAGKNCQGSIEGIDPQVEHAMAGRADRFQVF